MREDGSKDISLWCIAIADVILPANAKVNTESLTQPQDGADILFNNQTSRKAIMFHVKYKLVTDKEVTVRSVCRLHVFITGVVDSRMFDYDEK